MLEELCTRAGNEGGGGILRFGCELWENARGCPGKYMHYILENVSMAARMEGNYSMGLRGLERWSARTEPRELDLQ